MGQGASIVDGLLFPHVNSRILPADIEHTEEGTPIVVHDKSKISSQTFWAQNIPQSLTEYHLSQLNNQ